LETTQAILLRKIRLTETSLIVTWLTETEGKLKTVAKGARSTRSRFGGLLDLFHLCEIQIARSRKSELHGLREVRLIKSHEHLSSDYPRLTLASYFVELIDLVTEPEHPTPELYDLLRRGLAYLDSNPASERALLHFETEMTRLLGIQHPTDSPAIAIGRTYQRLPASRPAAIAALGR
jgi:DNA repair protein RecO (recombination protein O)